MENADAIGRNMKVALSDFLVAVIGYTSVVVRIHADIYVMSVDTAKSSGGALGYSLPDSACLTDIQIYPGLSGRVKGSGASVNTLLSMKALI